MKPEPILRSFKLVLPLALLAYFLWRYVDVDTFIFLAGSVGLAPVAAYVASLLAARWLQAIQARIALRESGVSIDPVDIFRVQLVSTFYTMFVPGDLVGGGVTWYMLKRIGGKGAAIATTLIYLRLVFLASAIPFVIFGMLMESRLHSASVLGALAIASTMTVILTAPLVFRSASRHADGLLLAIAHRLGGRMAGTRRALTVVRESITTCAAASPRSTAIVFGLAVALHLLGAVGLALASEAANANVPAHAFFWIWPLMIVVHMLPISIGGLGVREITLIYLLGKLYSTPAENALLLSMIALAATVVFSLAGGAWNSLRAGLPDNRPG